VGSTVSTLQSLQTDLVGLGYTMGPAASPLATAGLAGASVLVVGNAWGDFSAAEIESVRAWVEQGGGLLLVGLGWSWEPYHPGTTIDDYPMMRLASPYGVRWLRSTIEDPTNAIQGSAVFHTFYPSSPNASAASAMALIDAEHAANGTDLASRLESDAALRLRFVRAHLTLAVAARELPSGHQDLQAIDDYLSGLASRQPASYGRLATLDESVVPTTARLRERFLRSWHDVSWTTPGARARIATATQMAGRRRQILEEFGIVLLDNQRLDASQLEHIYTYFSLTPPALHALRAISVARLSRYVAAVDSPRRQPVGREHLRASDRAAHRELVPGRCRAGPRRRLLGGGRPRGQPRRRCVSRSASTLRLPRAGRS
jgi:hypothetical protein